MGRVGQRPPSMLYTVNVSMCFRRSVCNTNACCCCMGSRKVTDCSTIFHTTTFPWPSCPTLLARLLPFSVYCRYHVPAFFSCRVSSFQSTFMRSRSAIHSSACSWGAIASHRFSMLASVGFEMACAQRICCEVCCLRARAVAAVRPLCSVAGSERRSGAVRSIVAVVKEWRGESQCLGEVEWAAPQKCPAGEVSSKCMVRSCFPLRRCFRFRLANGRREMITTYFYVQTLF